MQRQQIIDRLIYVMVVVLSLAALWLVATAPADFMNVGVVYQGF
jgi:hypothetical protein